MFFSFIIPVYNTEKYLDKCLNSILIQDYTDFEIILIDDGSTDNSGEMCDNFSASDKRVRVFHIQNGGLSNARNFGIKKALGEYIIFIDSDDYWNSNFLKMAKIKLNNADLLAFNFVRVNDNKIKDDNLNHKFHELKAEYTDGVYFLSEALSIEPLYQWIFCTYIIKKDLILKNELYFTPGKKYEDALLLYKIILAARKIIVYDEEIYSYRIEREGAITNTITKQSLTDMLSVAREAIMTIQEINIPDEVKNKLYNNFSNFYFSALTLAYRLDKSNDFHDFCKLLSQEKWMTVFAEVKVNRIMLLSINIFGIENTAKMLGFRRYLKKFRSMFIDGRKEHENSTIS